MTVALVGGLDRLRARYIEEAGSRDIKLKVFTEKTGCLGCRIAEADAIIVCTDCVAHQSSKEALRVARTNNVPLFRTRRSVAAVKRSLSAAKLIDKAQG